LSNKKDKVWILTFEYKGIAKVGGLGEVPANQALSLKDYYNFQVFIPSHGQLERIEKEYLVKKLPIECFGEIQLRSQGIYNIKGNYEIGFYKFKLNGIEIILLKGENEFTEQFLDDNGVYNPDTFEGKLALYTKGMQCYLCSLISNSKENIPDVVHLHDFHAVIPYISMKQELFRNNLEIPSIITIHLLTWPRYDLEFLRNCGINDTPIKIRREGGIEEMTIEEIFHLLSTSEEKKDKKPPTMEKIGAFICDLVISVSKSYLESEIIPNLGDNLIKYKADFVWNGSDWDYYEMRKKVLNDLEKDIRDYLHIPTDQEITRYHMKDFLLTYKIGNLDQSPLINSKKILHKINQISNGNQFVKNGRIKAFNESGPLAITTGRISKQKGFEVILESIPKIIKVIPDAKFLFLILPTEYSIDKIEEYSQYVKKYQKNLRIIFGVASDIFNLAHLSADVYCALSRWEPFGIIALEAMASKLPVIATKVGGLQESVIDIRKDSEKGTGILINKDDKEDFIAAVMSIFQLSNINETFKRNNEIDSELIKRIPDKEIRKLAKENPSYYTKMKENCYKRVKDKFRWTEVSKRLRMLYEQIIDFHNNP